ncbi:hypothetical protein [Ancylomarina sp. 16SWW S1-10-2]|uniref:hypothetical protein n=1 Tax=Ancylomarina sp. 16SWW S1-10-2 TaxID=2499681 RepID=UPI0012AE6B5B|nr:hypothetical protein [Ancylomarina sp. 16SWW S1-10-2]MRT93454.1 hypothetical protein [Ancylomarina sp. 16SWW S1-10-2]
MEIKEIGSVFHTCQFPPATQYLSFPDEALYYGCGRYAINALIIHHIKIGEWKRLYVPEYFCYKVIGAIRTTGIELVFYADSPLEDDETIIDNIDFIKGDVLLRMNYFGLRSPRDNSNLNVPVIEDHTHDLFSEWALNSNADWCIASLRKSLPIPDGGMLWSPKHEISNIEKPTINQNHTKLSDDRYRAMMMKRLYLDSKKSISKSDYLNLFNETEAVIGNEEISRLSSFSEEILRQIPSYLNQKKKDNYEILLRLIETRTCKVVHCKETHTPFSFVLLFENNAKRNLIRQELIKRNIYPIVLWEIENLQANNKVVDFSKRMLTLPIDFRYSEMDMYWMSQVINAELLKI